MMFSPKEEKEIIQAIKEAEAMSTGEIRVHLDQNLKGDALATAQHIFHKIGMHKTIHRNGVLIYISENKRQIAIVGDENIHKHVKQSFWNELINEMTVYFKQEKYKEGLVSAILKAGAKLKLHFPTHGRINEDELPNTISR